MAQWLTNPTRNHEVAGLTQWVKDPSCHELCCRSQTVTALLWLWCRPQLQLHFNP